MGGAVGFCTFSGTRGRILPVPDPDGLAAEQGSSRDEETGRRHSVGWNIASTMARRVDGVEMGPKRIASFASISRASSPAGVAG